MILCNVALEIQELIEPEFLQKCITECVEEVFKFQLGDIIIENLDLDYKPVDCFEGRLVNPGHAIEAMWFIMDLGAKSGD